MLHSVLVAWGLPLAGLGLLHSCRGAGSRRVGFSECGSWAPGAGSVAVAMSLVTSEVDGESSWTSGIKCPQLDRWIPTTVPPGKSNRAGKEMEQVNKMGSCPQEFP